MASGLSCPLGASPRLTVIGAGAAIVMLGSIAWSIHRKPRPWAVKDVPIAFWAWRNEAPAQFDVRNVMHKTQARTLFLRAGQIDYEPGNLSRIRSVTGSLPQGIELHLVYNA